MTLEYKTSEELLKIYQRQPASSVDTSGANRSPMPTYKTSAELMDEIQGRAA